MALKININGDPKNANKAIDSVDKNLKDLGNTGKKQAKKISSEMKSMAKGAIAAFATFKSVTMTKELIQAGAQIEQTTGAFQRLASVAGESGDQILKKLKEMSGGAISEFNLMSASARGSLLGIGFKDQVKLMEIARATSRATGQTVTKAFDDVVLAVGRGSKLILDNLGIVLDVEKANKKYAESIGKTVTELTDLDRKQAFLNATFEAGAIHVKNLGVSTKTTAEKLATLGANIDNSTDKLKTKLAKTFFPLIENWLTGLNIMMENLDETSRRALVAEKKHLETLIKTNKETKGATKGFVEFLNSIRGAKGIDENTKKYAEQLEEVNRQLALLDSKSSKNNDALRKQKNLLNGVSEADRAVIESIEKKIKLRKEEERMRAAYTKSLMKPVSLRSLREVSDEDKKLIEEEEKIQEQQIENFKNFKEKQLEEHKRVLDAGLEYDKEVAEKEAERLREREEKIKSVTTSISDSFATNVADMLFGYKTLEEATRNWAKTTVAEIGKIISKLIAMKIVTAMFGKTPSIDAGLFGGGKAAGGPVNPNTSYLVGERGPEILTMGSQRGNIIPNHNLGAQSSGSKQSINVTYNINAIDSKSFNEYAQQNQGTFLMPLQNAVSKGDQGVINTLRDATA